MNQLLHETQIWLLRGARMENKLTRANVFSQEAVSSGDEDHILAGMKILLKQWTLRN